MAPSHAAARRTFSKLDTPLDVPNLIGIQRRSFERLTDPKAGMLRETIDDVSPIEDYTGNLAVVFEDIHFDEPVAPISECREKDLTYARPLTVKVAFQNRETGEIREQSVFMGDFPWMTDWGTFIIDGTERAYMKLVVDRASQRVLGAHMVGADAGEIIQGVAIAVKLGATKAQFDATIGIHPTAAEEFVTMREKSA